VSARRAAGQTGPERRQRDRSGKDQRHHAREAAVQMLYQWEIGRQSIPEVTQSYWTSGLPDHSALPDDLRQFATMLTHGVVSSLGEIDPMLAEAAVNWRLERMAVMDRIVLRLAVYELLRQPETPARVIINEALELARTFSSDEAVPFVNGVLDSIRRRLERA